MNTNKNNTNLSGTERGIMPFEPEPVTPWEIMPFEPEPVTPWEIMPFEPEPVTPW